MSVLNRRVDGRFFSMNNCLTCKGETLNKKYCSPVCFVDSRIGKPRSEELKQKVSLKLKGHIVSSETKEKIKKSIDIKIQSGEFMPNISGLHGWPKGKPRSEETKRKISLAKKGMCLSDEWKQNIGLGQLGRKFSKETKAKMSLASKGKPKSEEAKQKMSLAHLGIRLSDKHRDSIGKAGKGRILTEEQKRKIGEKNKISLKGHKISEETLEKMGKYWENLSKEKKNIIIQKRLKSLKIRPNKLEIKFESILKSIDNKWKYVGDGQLIINGKCPDFWDGAKNLIELYGDYWHKGENPQERIDFFLKEGFNMLIIWEKELKNNLNIVLNKLEKLNARNTSC